jgi:ATP-dependent helicase IRC3
MDIAAPQEKGRLQQLPLRDYQQDCLDAILSKYQEGVHRQLVSMATGAGKTVVFSHIIRRLECPTLVIAHTNELLGQARDKIRMVCPELDVGIVNGSIKELDSHVVVASIQSARQPETLHKLIERDFELLIYDECHHSASDTSKEVLSKLGFDGITNKLLVGFTATPFRQDERGLAEVFDEIVFEKSIGELIEEGYLCPPRGIRVAINLDLREVAQSQGDYSSKGMSLVMDTQELRGLAVRAYQEHAEGIPAIVFTCSVGHAKRLERDFKTMGVVAETIHGEMPRSERERILSGYKRGDIQVLCNCQVLTEGFDAPQTSCVIVARPTKSKGLYQQMVGRGLRKHPNKNDCVVIDFNDRAHTLCNAATLLRDAEVAEQQEKERQQREREILEDVPDRLNKKLKSAYVRANLFSESFNWTQEGNHYLLKGTDGFELWIGERDGLYKVVTRHGSQIGTLAEDLNFEYAFAAAEDYAAQHRELFILSDKGAAWRDLPISEKQKLIFRSKGYRAGVDHLTRGQASDLIASGALRRAG